MPIDPVPIDPVPIDPVPIDPVPSDPGPDDTEPDDTEPDDTGPNDPGPGDPGSGDVDLASVAEELYGLPLAQFTATRDARAAQARKAGAQELATAIKGLKKPTTGAWLANLLVRERRAQVGQLLDLGAELRQAQAGLAVDELRRLSQARHKVVSDLRDEARVLAREVGQPVSEAVALELEATLEAALADADAADALRSGRLTTSLRYSGLGLSDAFPVPAGATGAPGASSGPRPQPAPRPVPGQAPAGNSVSGSVMAKSRRSGRPEPRDRALLEAKDAVRIAGAAAEEAERDAAEQRRRARERREEVDRAHHQVIELEGQLRELRAVEDTVSQELRKAEMARDATDNKLREAHDQLTRAQTALELLTPSGP